MSRWLQALKEPFVHTGVLEDEMSFHGIVLLVDAVLARGVEVELSELVGAALSNQSAVGQDNLKAGAQVLKLGIVGAGNMKVYRVGAGVVNLLGDDVNRRLVLAGGAGRVLLVQAVPGQRTAGVRVVEGVDINNAISCTG